MNDPDSLVPLLYLLPVEWRNAVIAALLFMGSMTVVVTLLKAIVPTLRELAARTAISDDDAAVGVLSDVINLFADIVEWCQRFAEVLAAHRAPPIKRSPPPLLALMLALSLAPSFASCAASQVRTHAQIADALSAPIVAAKQTIERRAREDVAEMRASGQDENSKIRALRARYLPVEIATNLVIVTHNSYVDEIQKAHADGVGLRTNIALVLLSRWAAMIREAESIGIHLAGIPTELREVEQ